MDKKAVFDFDQTLIRKNSFTKWVAFLWCQSLKKLDFELFCTISTLIFRRKIIKTLSHQTFKKELIQLNIKKDYLDLFIEKLGVDLNENVLRQLIELDQSDYKIALSSAAPEIYLKEFVRKYISIKEILVIGSRIENNVLNDNFGEKKVENLIAKKFLNQNSEFEILFTDSSDDLFLATLAKEIYLISPDNESKNKFLEIFPEKLKIKE